MKFIATPLEGAYVVELNPFKDDRGLFARTFCKNEFLEIKHNKEFVQMNHSLTVQKYAIRGLHYQVFPSCEIKLVRCIRGKVYDVIVDLRKDSPTLLQYTTVELSEENMKMIYIPEGFAHGFQTLEDNCQLIYLHSNFYDPKSERGIRYDDPLINIQWPSEPTLLSEKDKSYALLEDQFEGIII